MKRTSDEGMVAAECRCGPAARRVEAIADGWGSDHAFNATDDR
jgi:hypothetical protein